MTPFTFRSLFQQLLRNKKTVILGHIVAIIATLISIPIPLLIPLLVDEVLLDKPGTLRAIIDTFITMPTALYYIAITLVATLLLRTIYFLLSALTNNLFTDITHQLSFFMREKLMTFLSTVAMHEYESLGSGEVAARLVTDLQIVESFISALLSKAVVALLTLLVTAVVLLLIDWRLGLLILLLHPTVVFITRLLSRKVSRFKKDENQAISHFQNALLENLELFLQIRASAKEHYFLEQNLADAKSLQLKSANFAKKSFTAERFSYTLFLGVFEFFRAAGLFMVAYSTLSIGLMFAVFGYLWFLMTPVQDLISLQYSFHNAKAALARINELFSKEQEPQYTAKCNPFVINEGASITTKNLSFSYQKSESLLDNISLHIQANTHVALIGASGSGKTTLAKILSALYMAQRGQLLYNNVPIEQIGLRTLRSHLYVVLQQSLLFNDTLLFNLTLGRPTDEEKIAQALKIAQLHSFVQQLPDGLQSVVGKHGMRLSGGQKQRISIARMILAEPNIVIFDESTSALDVHTEANLFEALQPFLAKRTVITIAHRLSTVSNSDYIYVLKEGQIVEEGTPQALQDADGHFQSFVKAQR